MTLEMNTYLTTFKRTLDKYGYCKVYCSGFFDGTKKKGLVFFIDADENFCAQLELNMIIDPCFSVGDNWQGSCLVIDKFEDWFIMQLGNPVYCDGEFHMSEEVRVCPIAQSV